MARGYPDYGNPNYQIAGTQVDLGALILAATGFQTVDGLGRLLWFDNFRNGRNAWDNGEVGNASPPVLVYENTEIPPASIRLGVGNTVVPSFAQFDWLGRSSSSPRLGFEYAFDFDSTDQYLDAYLWRPAPDRVQYGLVRVTQSTGLIEIYSGGAWQTITTFTGLSTYDSYTVIKLVCDFDLSLYQRLMVGDQLFDLSAYATPDWPGPVSKRVWVQFLAYPLTVTLAYVKIGHVAITADEP